MGGVTLICHIHTGLETCDGCEPGLIISNYKQANNNGCNGGNATKEDLEKARKRELKKIRKKFGLKQHEDEPETPAGYQDRAEVRRQKVGIDPVGAKTEVASVQVPIAKKNKGFQMLAKMGWNEGQALGKTEASDAITEPVTSPLKFVFSTRNNLISFDLFSCFPDHSRTAGGKGRFRSRGRSRASGVPVIDVEKTKSRSPGEDSTTLFSSAVSSTLLLSPGTLVFFCVSLNVFTPFFKKMFPLIIKAFIVYIMISFFLC